MAEQLYSAGQAYLRRLPAVEASSSSSSEDGGDGAAASSSQAALIASLLVIFVVLPLLAYMTAVVSSNRAQGEDAGADAGGPRPLLNQLCPCLRPGPSAGAAVVAGRQGGPNSSGRQIVVSNPLGAVHAAAAASAGADSSAAAGTRAPSPPKQTGPLTGKAWLEKRKADKEAAAKAAEEVKAQRRRSRSGSGGSGLAAGSKQEELASDLKQYQGPQSQSLASHSSVKNLLRRTSVGGTALAYEPPAAAAPPSLFKDTPGKDKDGKTGQPRRIGDRGLHGVLKDHQDKSLVNEVKEVLTNHGVDVKGIEQKLEKGLQNLPPLHKALPHLPAPQHLFGHAKHGPIAAEPGGGHGAGVEDGVVLKVADLGLRHPPPPRSQRIAAASKPVSPPPARDKMASTRMAFGPQHGHVGMAGAGAGAAAASAGGRGGAGAMPPPTPDSVGSTPSGTHMLGMGTTPGSVDNSLVLPSAASLPGISFAAGSDLRRASVAESEAGQARRASRASNASLDDSPTPTVVSAAMPATALPPRAAAPDGSRSSSASGRGNGSSASAGAAAGLGLDVTTSGSMGLPPQLRTPTHSAPGSARASVDGSASPSVLPANIPRPPTLPPPPVEGAPGVVTGLGVRLEHLRNMQAGAGSRASLLPPPMLPPPQAAPPATPDRKGSMSSTGPAPPAAGAGAAAGTVSAPSTPSTNGIARPGGPGAGGEWGAAMMRSPTPTKPPVPAGLPAVALAPPPTPGGGLPLPPPSPMVANLPPPPGPPPA